jgi:nucleotide-binding universal stress UspA family protein
MMAAGATLSRIIVPLDGGPVAEQAIPVASVLAAHTGVPITLVTVLSDHDLEDNATVYLEARAAQIQGPRVDIEVLHGMPAGDTLVEYVEGHPGALICCSTHARLDAKRFMLGSVAEELVRRSPAPVILVGPRAARPEPDGGYDEIIICAEDESARRVVPYARILTAAGLHPSLLQVVEPSYGARRPEGPHQSALLADLHGEFAEDSKVDAELVEDRNVPLTIATVARRRSAPILALSSRPRYSGERYEESSVTVAIARIADCPVLVVGPSVPVSRP